MGRRAILQRVEKEPETPASFLRRDPEQAEHPLLGFHAMNPDRARSELPAVDDHVVGARADTAGIGLETLQIFLARRGEGMVHGKPDP